MSIIKTEAFVLKSFRFGESSKIVTLFTKDFGKINAIVKGARNYKSKLCGTLETMNYINVVAYIKVNRDLHLISNAEYKNSFTNIINNFDKLQAAYRIIELLNKSLTVNDVNEKIFKLLIDTYSNLNNSTKNYFLYVLYFQIELTKILGLSPDFPEIIEDNETFFENNEFYLSKSLFNTFLEILKINIEEIEFTAIEEEVTNKLIQSYDIYLSKHTHGYKFYNSTRVFSQIKKYK